MEGPVVQRQAAHTLKCMQTLTRVQSQIRSRRIRMSEENQARHKQLLHKHAKELGGLKVSLLYISQELAGYTFFFCIFLILRLCSFFSRVGVIGMIAISPRNKSKQVC